MKRALTFVFMLYSVFLGAQSVSDTLSDFYIQTANEGTYITGYKNFPSISRKAKYIAVIHRDYSCCIENPEVLTFIKLDSSQISFDKNALLYNNTIVLAGEKEDSSAFADRINKLKKVKKAVRKEKFSRLIQLDTFGLSGDTSAQSRRIIFFHRGTKYVSEDFIMEKILMKSYCCSGLQIDNSHCEQMPVISRVWYHDSYKIILLEYGISQLANGCEVGPLYRVIRYR